MSRRGLVDEAIQGILDRVVDGGFPAGSALPPEADLAALLEVSRPTMREAVRSLSDRGVLRVVHGRGTFVAPREEWRDLPTLIGVLARTTPSRDLGLQLIQVRRMLEVGAAGLAAENRNDVDLTAMRAVLDGYDEAAARADVDEVVRLDLAFHGLVLKASGNPFLAAIMQPLAEALSASRQTTAAREDVRARAQEHHRRILEAISGGDASAAKDAMRAHMKQTHDDIAAL
ncbi:FadR family transcriptional regulator [Tessaracoccus sp. MC1679]|uniref:FadR/GntR family transcriptional regulator n=1 Tax=unclassified Tessaracoccus TaxID=2635419 RepID=UPI0015FEFAB3|nr:MULTISPECIES: FadR/GntR family transcriptional regulator [unclassified Tessaracoccus]MBB1511033.1 FadR family transcriptional regulator [Tessaracoccus sp. MC1627]MBB1517280.1 FadR family transcriptional regulator [Tessaracoccus sp. MC1679]